MDKTKLQTGDELQTAQGTIKHNSLVYFATVLCIGTSLVNLGCIFYFIRAMGDIQCTGYGHITKDSGNQNIGLGNYSSIQHLHGTNAVHLDANKKSVVTDEFQQGSDLEQVIGVRLKRQTEQKKRNKKKQNNKKLNNKKRGNKKRNRSKMTKVAQYIGAIPGHSKEFIEFTEPSSWVTERGSPVHHNKTEFIIKKNGLYFVYAQVMFPGNEIAKYAAILHERGNVTVASFKCKTGLFVGRNRIDQLQTCTIIGLVQATSGDKLRVQNESFAKIDTLRNTVYFGIMKMS